MNAFYESIPDGRLALTSASAILTQHSDTTESQPEPACPDRRTLARLVHLRQENQALREAFQIAPQGRAMTPPGFFPPLQPQSHAVTGTTPPAGASGLDSSYEQA